MIKVKKMRFKCVFNKKIVEIKKNVLLLHVEIEKV
jgi:hypothetical protein